MLCSLERDKLRPRGMISHLTVEICVHRLEVDNEPQANDLLVLGRVKAADVITLIQQAVFQALETARRRGRIRGRNGAENEM